MRNILTKIVNLLFKRDQVHSEYLRHYYKKYKGISVGKYSYGCFTNKIPSGTIIGNYCSFGPDVKIFNANHGIQWASTHPFLYNTALGVVNKEQVKRTSLVIGSDVWIGANVVILPSVKKIGNGAVIGAGSIVTKDIEPYSVNAGNPCKIIRYRFEKNYIKTLEESKIYNYSKQEFVKNLDNMYDKENFSKLRKHD